MDFDILVGDLIIFHTKRDQECAFIEFVKPDQIKCWMKRKKLGEMELGLLNVKHISVEELKNIKLWDRLDADVQKSVEKFEDIININIHNKMVHARKSRKNKYPNMPVEITCITCGDEITINKAQVAKKVEKLGIGLDQFIKQFECRTCKPVKRGRAKKDYGDVPDRMTCKCGHVVKYQQSAIISMAKKKGMTVKELVNGYACTTCRPVKRGKAKKDYGDVPDRMTCKCGHATKYHPSMIIKLAKKKGITVEKLIKKYRCRGCKKRK